jgi:mRNA interferase RelE/StbE
MNWKLKYSDKARKQLRKLDATQRAIILSWRDKNIDGCDDPRAHGKGLVENHTGEWRYRIGDFRVLCDIRDGRLVVLTLKVDHRSKVYKR